MIYSIQTKKSVPIKYRANYKEYITNKEVTLYVGFINPYDDYIMLSTMKPKEAIWHTKRELPQVVSLLQKEGIDYTIHEVKKCDVCEGSGFLDIDVTCPKCEP